MSNGSLPVTRGVPDLALVADIVALISNRPSLAWGAAALADWFDASDRHVRDACDWAVERGYLRHRHLGPAESPNQTWWAPTLAGCIFTSRLTA